MLAGLTRRALAASLIVAALPFTSACYAGQVDPQTHRFAPGAVPAPLAEWRARDVRMAGVSLDQAVAMAERRFNAKVVKAGVTESNGRRVYVLRLLSEQGRVWTVRVDADSGSVM